MRIDDQNPGDPTYSAYHLVLLDVLGTMCAAGSFSVSFWGPASAVRRFLNVLAEHTMCSLPALLSELRDRATKTLSAATSAARVCTIANREATSAE